MNLINDYTKIFFNKSVNRNDLNIYYKYKNLKRHIIIGHHWRIKWMIGPNGDLHSFINNNTILVYFEKNILNSNIINIKNQIIAPYVSNLYILEQNILYEEWNRRNITIYFRGSLNRGIGRKTNNPKKIRGSAKWIADWNGDAKSLIQIQNKIVYTAKIDQGSHKLHPQFIEMKKRYAE
eukprot:935552_1